MEKQRRKDIIKKTCIAVAICSCIVLFFAFAARYGQTSPENPMDKKTADASCMYLTSSTLAMDQEILADVENANINTGTKGQAQETEAEEEEQEEEQEEEPEESRQEERLQETAEASDPEQIREDPSVKTEVNTTSLASLIQRRKGEKGEIDPSLAPESSGGNGSGTGTGGAGGGASGNKPGGDGNGIPSGGGGSTVLTPEDSGELFTTSIQDGEILTDPAYSFTIALTEKGEKLTLTGRTITLNGSSFQGKIGQNQIRLKEGENTVRVSLRFRDNKLNQIDASTKTYTLYYNPENKVLFFVKDIKKGEMLPDQGDYRTYEPEIQLEIHAMKGREETEARVRMSARTVKPDSDGIYRIRLSVGNKNQLKITAVTGVNNEPFLCRIEYKIDDFVLNFQSDAVTEQIKEDDFGSYTKTRYRSETEDFAFKVTCSENTGLEEIRSIQVTTRYGTTEMKGMEGADGYIRHKLDASPTGTTIYVECTDSEGHLRNYTWILYFERIITEEENDKKAPVVNIQLIDGETVNYTPYVLPIIVYDYRGNVLPPTRWQVYFNGELLSYSSLSTEGVYEYNLYMTEGENTVVVRAEDYEQYKTVKKFKIFFSPDDESFQIRFIFSADVLGLGTLIDENVFVSSGNTVAQVVEDRLQAYGYDTVHDGFPTAGDYFLRHIQKPGIADGWYISDEERELVESEGFSVYDPVTTDSLGEKDFTDGSGWMVTLNHYFIGQSMGTRAIRDGDEIHIMYTLDVGNDVNVNPDGGIY